MEYKIIGDLMQALRVDLTQGEEMYAEAGSMLYMSEGIEFDSKMKGGILGGLARKFLAGESLFMSVFRCNAPRAHMAFGAPITAEKPALVIPCLPVSSACTARPPSRRPVVSGPCPARPDSRPH